MTSLTLTEHEAQCLREAITEMIQDDAEKLETPEWLLADLDRAFHLKTRFAALSVLLQKLTYPSRA